MHIFINLINISKRKISVGFLSILALALSACGGSGGGSSTSGSGNGTTASACAVTSTSAGTLLGGAIQGTPLNLTTKVSTMAGTGTSGSLDATCDQALLSGPIGITSDGSNLYVADTTNHKIRKIVLATGVVTTLAGSGTAGSTDATGLAARFNAPMGITNDGSNLYVSDTFNHKIRKIVISTGVVSTLAGTGSAGSLDATGTSASFNSPHGITTDGSNLYIADTSNQKVRQIAISTGAVTTLAGSGTLGSAEGTGTAASFSSPLGVTITGSNLYVAEGGNYKVRQIVISTKVVSTFAGSGTIGTSDGIGTLASFSQPYAITSDGIYLYVADANNHNIRRITISNQAVSTLAGSGTAGTTNATGTTAKFNTPQGITTDGINLYVADTFNHKIRKIE